MNRHSSINVSRIAAIKSRFSAWLLLPYLMLAGGCADLPRNDDPQRLPVLSKAIGTEPDQIRMLSQGDWWQQEGFDIPHFSELLRLGVTWMLGDHTSVVVLTDKAIHIASPSVWSIGYKSLAQIPFNQIVNVATMDEGRVLVLRRRDSAGNGMQGPRRDFIRFFEGPPLVAGGVNPFANKPGLAEPAARHVNAHLLNSPQSARIPGWVPLAERDRIVAVVAPSWRPAITVASTSTVGESAKAGASAGDPLMSLSIGLAAIGGGVAAVPIFAAGVVVGAVGALTGAVVGAAKDAGSKQVADERERHSAIVQSRMPDISEAATGHAALQNCFLQNVASMTSVDIESVGQKPPLLLPVTDLSAESTDDRFAYASLIDERIQQYLEIRLRGIEFFADAVVTGAQQPAGRPVRMRVKAEYVLAPSLRGRFDRPTRAVQADEVTTGHTISDWAANSGALVSAELKAACEKLGRKIREQLFPEARRLAAR